MKYKLYLIASLIFMVLGIGHILAEFISHIFLNPHNNELYKEMNSYYIHIFGFSRSIHRFMEGYSLAMGFMMLAYGGLNVTILKKWKAFVLDNKVIHLINAFVALVMTILSVIYFHWPPIICYSISATCFIFVFLKSLKK